MPRPHGKGLAPEAAAATRARTLAHARATTQTHLRVPLLASTCNTTVRADENADIDRASHTRPAEDTLMRQLLIYIASSLLLKQYVVAAVTPSMIRQHNGSSGNGRANRQRQPRQQRQQRRQQASGGAGSGGSNGSGGDCAPGLSLGEDVKAVPSLASRGVRLRVCVLVYAGLQVCSPAGLLICRSRDLKVCRFVGLRMCWCGGV